MTMKNTETSQPQAWRKVGDCEALRMVVPNDPSSPTAGQETQPAKAEQDAPPAVGCSAWLDHTVEVKLDNDVVWQRRHENGNPGGITARNKPMLEKVVAVLGEAIMQAQCELSLLLDDGNRILDGRLVTLSNVQRDVPVAGVRRSDDDGEAPIKSTAIGEAPAALEVLKLAVGSEHDIALGVAVNSNGVTVVQILSGVNKLHSGVVVVWSNE